MTRKKQSYCEEHGLFLKPHFEREGLKLGELESLQYKRVSYKSSDRGSVEVGYAREANVFSIRLKGTDGTKITDYVTGSATALEELLPDGRYWADKGLDYAPVDDFMKVNNVRGGMVYEMESKRGVHVIFPERVVVKLLMVPLNLGVKETADKTGMNLNALEKFLAGIEPLTRDDAEKLAKLSDNPNAADMLMKLQENFDRLMAKKNPKMNGPSF